MRRCKRRQVKDLSSDCNKSVVWLVVEAVTSKFRSGVNVLCGANDRAENRYDEDGAAAYKPYNQVDLI